jgi:fatty acid desaturase
LQRAGIDLGGSSLDDIGKGKVWDDANYRHRAREAVFEVPDRELRYELTRAVNRYQYEHYERWESLGLFEEKFANELRRERCRPPQPALLLGAITLHVPFLGMWYWLFGALDALVVGMITFPLFFLFPTISFIIELYRHEVTLREAIKLVDMMAAKTQKEAARRLDLPEIFSSREIRTGVMASEMENP